MERHPEVFDQLFRSMVRSGEQSGRLEEALDRVAFHLEKIDALTPPGPLGDDVPDLRLRLRGRHPDRGRRLHRPGLRRGLRGARRRQPGESAELPLPTQICVTLSDVVTGYWYVIFPALIAVGLRLHPVEEDRRAGAPSGTASSCGFPFKIGDVVQKVALARWSRTFSGAVSSGVPILQSIKLTGDTSGNVVVEEAMEDVYASVKSGGSIADPIDDNADLPRRWSPTWSRSARRPASSSTC